MTMKRRRFFAFLTNEPPQRYFIVMQFFILAAMMLFLLYNAFELFQEFATSAEALNLSAGQFQLHLKDLYTALLLRILIIFLVGFLVNAFFGLLFLHRVTGPLVRVRHILDKIADGEYPEAMIHFRRGDFAKEVALALSRLLDFLNRSGVSIKPNKEKPAGP